MTREPVRRALAASLLQSTATSMAVFDDPDTTLYLDQEIVPTTDLLTTYRRSLEHVQDIGHQTVGLRETVERLAATPHETLRTVDAEGPDGHSCVVFLTPDLGEVVAAVAVLEPRSPT